MVHIVDANYSNINKRNVNLRWWYRVENTEVDGSHIPIAIGSKFLFPDVIGRCDFYQIKKFCMEKQDHMPASISGSFIRSLSKL